METQDYRKLGYVGSIQPASDTIDRNDWYTPAKYIEVARRVLGRIDYDPYSDAIANQTVKAKQYRTKDCPREWPDEIETVWMNPPYGRGLIECAVNEFLREYEDKGFNAIVVVNNATETAWFHKLLNACDRVCFTNHRIAFETMDGKAVSGNTRGQAFLYFGFNVDKFELEFWKFGTILR